MAAFAAFEEKDAYAPSAFLNITPKRNSAGVRTFASRKSAAAFRIPPPLVFESNEKEPELSRLTELISNLRKVGNPDHKQKLPPDKSDQQACEILKMLAQLRQTSPNPKNTGTHNAMQAKELMEILANLRKVGALRYKMNRKETEALEDIIKRLRKVRMNLDDGGDEAKELDDIIGNLENIGMGQEFRGLQVMEDAIARLRKNNKANITPKVVDVLGGPDNTDEMEDIVTKLDKLRARMSQREEDELAEAIRKLRHVEGSAGSDADDLARVLKDLQLVGAAPEDQEAPSTPQSSSYKPSREESDYLKTAIQRLKKARMTKREAEAVADIVINLRKVVFAQDESSSKEPPEIDELRNTFQSPSKADEVVDVIKGLLRKVQMSEEEAMYLADIIRTFGTGERNFRNDLADAIARLKKVKMNKKETAAVAYVIRNLRKVTKDSPEMVAIEKVFRPERYDEVVDAISALKKLDLTVQEAGELADVVQDMGSVKKDPILLDLDEWDTGSVSDMSETGEMALTGSSDDDFPLVRVSYHKGAPLADDDEESMNSLEDEAEAPDLDEGSMNALEYKADEPEPHKIIHAERHHWKHKKHWTTVQGDRRYRPKEQRNTTVVYSALSTSQKDRRRRVEASMNASLPAIDAGSLDICSSDDEEDHNASWVRSKEKVKKKGVRRKVLWEKEIS